MFTDAAFDKKRQHLTEIILGMVKDWCENKNELGRPEIRCGTGKNTFDLVMLRRHINKSTLTNRKGFPTWRPHHGLHVCNICCKYTHIWSTVHTFIQLKTVLVSVVFICVCLYWILYLSKRSKQIMTFYVVMRAILVSWQWARFQICIILYIAQMDDMDIIYKMIWNTPYNLWKSES